MAAQLQTRDLIGERLASYDPRLGYGDAVVFQKWDSSAFDNSDLMNRPHQDMQMKQQIEAAKEKGKAELARLTAKVVVPEFAIRDQEEANLNINKYREQMKSAIQNNDHDSLMDAIGGMELYGKNLSLRLNEQNEIEKQTKDIAKDKYTDHSKYYVDAIANLNQHQLSDLGRNYQKLDPMEAKYFKTNQYLMDGAKNIDGLETVDSLNAQKAFGGKLLQYDKNTNKVKFFKKDEKGNLVEGVSDELIGFTLNDGRYNKVVEQRANDKILQEAQQLKNQGDPRPIDEIKDDLSLGIDRYKKDIVSNDLMALQEKTTKNETKYQNLPKETTDERKDRLKAKGEVEGIEFGVMGVGSNKMGNLKTNNYAESLGGFTLTSGEQNKQPMPIKIDQSFNTVFTEDGKLRKPLNKVNVKGELSSIDIFPMTKSGSVLMGSINTKKVGNKVVEETPTPLSADKLNQILDDVIEGKKIEEKDKVIYDNLNHFDFLANIQAFNNTKIQGDYLDKYTDASGKIDVQKAVQNADIRAKLASNFNFSEEDIKNITDISPEGVKYTVSVPMSELSGTIKTKSKGVADISYKDKKPVLNAVPEDVRNQYNAINEKLQKAKGTKNAASNEEIEDIFYTQQQVDSSSLKGRKNGEILIQGGKKYRLNIK